MAKDEVTVPLRAEVNASFGDIAVLLEEGRKHAVHTAVATAEDGSTIHFIGKDVQAFKVPAVNPVLPDAVKQTEVLIEPDSFKDYLIKFASPTAICRASEKLRTITAVLDYHGQARSGDRETARPGLSQHVVTLNCPWDVDYEKWRKVLGTFLEQELMIAFLEDMIHTISEPAAADLLEAMSDIEISRSVKFKSKRNDKNGNLTIGYEEVDEGGARSGEFTLPDHISIVVPIFVGGNAIQLVAKLRVRMDKGVLGIGFAVPGLEKLEREAFRSIAEDVRKATATPVFYVA